MTAQFAGSEISVFQFGDSSSIAEGRILAHGVGVDYVEGWLETMVRSDVMRRHGNATGISELKN